MLTPDGLQFIGADDLRYVLIRRHGTGKIATRLTELGRLNASGVNKWAHGVVSRVLNNQTYMGVMAYGKSFSNNYLKQRQVNNFDRSTYM